MNARAQTIDNNWQDLTVFTVGIWLFLSPFILQFITKNGKAAVAAFLLGVAISMFAMTGIGKRQAWGELITLILGVVLLGLPWIMGLSRETVIWNVVLAGGIVAICSVWGMIQKRSEAQNSNITTGVER